VATRAGVKKLVLSHIVPADDPTITDDIWRAGAQQHFSGDVIVGRDLLVV
jgi:ribonuclease BN (tRNA processing enzyme)